MEIVMSSLGVGVIAMLAILSLELGIRVGGHCMNVLFVKFENALCRNFTEEYEAQNWRALIQFVNAGNWKITGRSTNKEDSQ